MEFFMASLIMLSMLKGLEAAAAIGLAGTNSKFPGMCIDEDTSRPYRLASSWQMTGTCGQKTCVQRGGNLYISYETCGYAQIAPSCYTVADISKDYPACCPKIVCDDEVPNKVNNNIKNEILSEASSNDITNEINSDEYGFYDVASYDDLYMMPSDESPSFARYDVVLPESDPYKSADYYSVWRSLSAQE